MSAGSNDQFPVKVNESDREAAGRALAQNWPDLESANPEYAALLEALSEFHHLFGADSFELRYNLRPPRDRTEEWTLQFMHGQITEKELRARLKEHAQRPIDLEMLTTFCNTYEDDLVHYSDVLRKTVLKPSDASNSARRARAQEIDEHVAAISGEFPLWRENLETVFEFLEELRITSGAGLVKVGEFEGTSAHWLAQLVFSRMAEAWRSCTEVSERSRRDPRYLYAASAIDLFCEQWLQSFPTPQSISERLREEFILARAALKRTDLAAPDATPELATTSSDARQSIDNESRELMLVGDMFRLVAQAGHIFRPTSNSDWGIDGEIEFKDGTGRANGQRVYVQLKSGDSHLVRRSGDGEEVFTVKNVRHLEYWAQHAYPVMLVIRQASGLIRWMNVSDYLKCRKRRNRQIVFRGEPLTVDAVRKLAEESVQRAS